jgi:hypothetical protein
VLLDSEGIDAYDQTGQYSTQIFSLAVLLSSLFVYNQVQSPSPWWFLQYTTSSYTPPRLDCVSTLNNEPPSAWR